MSETKANAPGDQNEQLLLSIKEMVNGFFSGEDTSAREAGRVLMAIDSKVTAALIQSRDHQPR